MAAEAVPDRGLWGLPTGLSTIPRLRAHDRSPMIPRSLAHDPTSARPRSHDRLPTVAQVQGMGPWMEAVTAYCPCRGCNYRQDDTLNHEKPHSFLKGGRWELRNKRAVSQQVRPASCAAAGIVCYTCVTPCVALCGCRQIKSWRQQIDAKQMQDAGINKLWFALMDPFFPGINFTNIAPQDIMHLFADGITRNEGAWLLYMLHSRGYLRLTAVNAAIRRYRWSRATVVPQIPQNVEDGVTGRYPRKDATLGMSASQTFVFAQHRCASGSQQYAHLKPAVCCDE